jgi:hypothetical protein
MLGRLSRRPRHPSDLSRLPCYRSRHDRPQTNGFFPRVRHRGGRRCPIRHVDFERPAMNAEPPLTTVRIGHVAMGRPQPSGKERRPKKTGPLRVRFAVRRRGSRQSPSRGEQLTALRLQCNRLPPATAVCSRNLLAQHKGLHACPYRKSNPDVLMVQTSEVRVGHDAANSLNSTRCRSILVQR